MGSQLFPTIDWRYPNLKLFLHGKLLKPEEYSETREYGDEFFKYTIDNNKVLDFYSKGATIVLHPLEQCWDPLTKFCSTLESKIGYPVSSRAFITPKDGIILDEHYDDFDVLFLQIAGSNKLRIWNEKEYHIENDVYKKFTKDMEHKLEPGDIAYIPRNSKSSFFKNLLIFGW